MRSVHFLLTAKAKILHDIWNFYLPRHLYVSNNSSFKKLCLFIDALNSNAVVRWIPVIALLIFFAGYSTGYVSVCFMLLGELLPSNGREIGSFVIVQCTNISSIILTKFVPDLQELLGLDGLFWLFSGVAIFSIIFAYLCVPETFGKTLEEIEEHYRKICYPNSVRGRHHVEENLNQAYISD